MAKITGAQSVAALKVASTWGTPVACTTGDKLVNFTIDHGEQAEALVVTPIGSGSILAGQSDRGNVAPRLSLQGKLGYNSPELVAIAQMFGGASVVGLGAGGTQAYSHSISLNQTANQKLFTAAWQPNIGSSIEYGTAAATKVTLNFPPPKDYIEATIDALADAQNLTSATNTYTTLAGCTAANTRRMVWSNADSFWCNAAAIGALSASNLYNIQSAVVEFNRPQEHPREATGSASQGEPVATGDFPFFGTLTVTFRSKQDHTFFAAHQAGTEFKARLNHVSSEAVGGTIYYALRIFFPRLKIVESPQNNLTSAGDNSETVVFQILEAASAPAGINSTTPLIEIVNDRSSALLS